MTVPEYQQTPEVVYPQELVFGHVVARDAPAVSHQRVVLTMAVALLGYCREHGGGVLIAPTDVVLDEELALVLQPDLLYVGPAGPARITDRVQGPPNLVIEIMSPAPRIGRVDEKVRWYAQYGVEEIWLCHHLVGTLDVLRCGKGTVLQTTRFGLTAPIQSRVLPNFRATTAEVCGI